MTDEEMVIAYKRSGENHWVGKLYERYAHLVLGVGIKYLKDKDDAKDAVMDVFQSLFVKLKEHDIERFRPWLYTLTRNHCLMILRKRKPEVSFNGTQVPDDQYDSISLKHLDEKRIVLLERAIGGLKPEQAKCVRAFYLQMKCYQEISTDLGMDLKRVKSHIQNGKRMLKIHLSEYPEFK